MALCAWSAENPGSTLALPARSATRAGPLDLLLAWSLALGQGGGGGIALSGFAHQGQGVMVVILRFALPTAVRAHLRICKQAMAAASIDFRGSIGRLRAGCSGFEIHHPPPFVIAHMEQIGLQQPLNLLGDGGTALAWQQIHLQQGVIEGEAPGSPLTS